MDRIRRKNWLQADKDSIMKIIVLAGGTSTEREISIVSGTGAAKAFKSKGYSTFLLDVFSGVSDEEAGRAFTEEQDIDAAAAAMKAATEQVYKEAKTRREFFGPNVIRLCQEADKVFLALHGMNGEDGKVQAAFDLFGIRYSGSGYLGSALAMDKGLTKILFNYFGVSTPKGFVIYKNDLDKTLSGHGLTLPVVVKPLTGGSSVGVAIARTENEYKEALETAFRFENKALVESYIDGREFSIAVVGHEAYPVVEIVVPEGFYDYENKYNGLTREICPADLPEEKKKEMQQMAVEAADALMISGYSRMDFLMDKEWKIYCIEANTLPGMTPTSLVPQEAKALGISYAELCETLMGFKQEKK